MTIGTRVWVAVVLLVASVVSVLGYLRVGAEQDILLEATIRNRRFFGRTLQAALLHVPPADTASAAQGIVGDERLRGGHMVITIAAPDASAAVADRLEADELEHFDRGDVALLVEPERIVTLVPLSARGETLEIEEPRAVHQHLASIAALVAIATSIGVAAIAGLLIWLITRALITRPLRALGAFTQRIGSGDLSGELDFQGTDEVSVFARELAQASHKLFEARVALDDLNHERVTLLHSLRHADRLRTVGTLAASIAHELGSPLATVQGHAQLIEARPELDERVHKSARVIGEQTKRMANLVRQLLDFGRRDSERGPHDLNEIAKVAAEMLEPLATKRGVVIHVTTVPTPLVVTVDRSQMLQVLTNLLGNALDVSPAGTEVSVAVSIDADDQRCAVSVANHGAGIRHGEVAQLFEPFFTTKPKGQGTGLGLSVARGIMQEHGGTLDVDGRASGGATFRASLPLPSPARG